MFGRNWGIAPVYGLAFFGLALVCIALVGNALGSLVENGEIGRYTLQNYAAVVAADSFPTVFRRTIVLGLGTVAVLLFFSLPFAWLLTRTDFAWKRTLFTLLTAKLAIPGFITAMAYVWLFNPTAGIVNKMLGAAGPGGTAAFDVYQLSWICFLQGVVLTPGAVFLLIPAFTNMDASLEEAAWVSGVSKARAMRRVVLPLLMPGVYAVALFFFVVGIEMFDIVAVIGMPARLDVLTIWIYDAMHPTIGLPNIGFAGAAGVLLFALCAVAIVFYVRFLRQAARYAVVGGKSRQFAPMPLGRWRWLASALVLSWVTVALAIPMAALAWVAVVPYLQPFSVDALLQASTVSFRYAMHDMGDALTNTFCIMAGAIVMSAALSLCITWLVTRTKSRAARWSDGLVFLAPAVPTIVLGVAYQYVGIEIYHWLPLYGTIWLVAIAMGVRFLAYCTRTMNTASLQIQFCLDEAALASGVSRFVSFRRIFLPLMAPAVFYTAVLVGMLAARDLTLPLMMLNGDSYTISTLIYDLQGNGASDEAAAMSLYMIGLLVALALFAHKISGIGASRADRVSRRRATARGSVLGWRRGFRRVTRTAAAE